MICYICGKKLLDSDKKDEDHAPQKGFFLSKNPPGIKKLLVHEKCNNDYSKDEQYVINHLRLAGNWNQTAEKIWKRRGIKSLTKLKSLGLVKKMLSEKTGSVNGNPIIQPDESRILKVLDKAVRGLYFDKFDKTLESGGYRIDSNEFIYYQHHFKIGLGFTSVGVPGEEEFKYLIRELEDKRIEYILFFYNTLFFRLLYKR